MMHEACKASVANGRNPHLAPQDLPAGRTSPVPEESAAADHAPSSSLLVEQWQQEIQASLRAGTSDEISVLKLVRHVLTHSDQAARSEAEQLVNWVKIRTQILA